MLARFLSYINMNQPQVYICPLPFKPPFHLPPHPTSLGCYRDQLKLPESYSKFLLAIYFTYGSVYVFMILSPFIPPDPLHCHPVGISLFSMFASPLLPCKQVHQYHLSRFHIYAFSSLQFSSVTQSCPTLCDPMNHSMPGLTAHHQLPEFTQTHVHRVGDAIQPSHPLSPLSPAFNLSQHKDLSKRVSSSHQVAKVLGLQLQHQSFQ